MNCHIKQRNLSMNSQTTNGDFINNRTLSNANASIRYLGYDSIFQFTLLAKLVFFMIVFGMNTEKQYRWLTLACVVSYYFYEVRDLYISHYQLQRRVLHMPEIVAQQDGQNLFDPTIIRQSTGAADSISQSVISSMVPRYTTSDSASRNWFYIAYVLIIHFILSLHNGWIDPVLRRYRQMYREEDR